MSTLVTGIGLIDPSNDPERDQVVANLAACQLPEPLSPAERRYIEDRVAALHGTDTNFFQRPSSGLLAPPVTVERATPTSPVIVHWHTAYAGGDPLVRYEVWRREEKIATLLFRPQTTEAPFTFTDEAAPDSAPGGVWYKVRAVDAAGRYADSITVKGGGAYPARRG
jgi:hypothetical protein